MGSSESKTEKLRECLTDLANHADYSTPELTRRTSAKSNRALNLIFEIGKEKAEFTAEQKSNIAALIVATLRHLQAHVERMGCVYRTRLDSAILRKRSAVQFLIDDYSTFPIGNDTLQKTFEQAHIEETIGILDDIICHLKAALHILTGDGMNAENAFYAASRTVAVMVGGAVGFTGGPACAVAAAAVAGIAVDIFISSATNRPHGLIDSVLEISYDISFGIMPMKSIIKTVLYVAADLMSGLAGKELANLTETTMEIAKPAFQMLVGGLTIRSVGESWESKYSGIFNPRQATGSDNATRTGTDSTHLESQPVMGNDSSFKSYFTNQNSHEITKFLEICDTKRLQDVKIAGEFIFSNLNPNQIKSFKKNIQTLSINGYLVAVIKVVRSLFDDVDPKDVTFENFLSLTQFVAAYLGDHVSLLSEVQRAECHENLLAMTFQERRQKHSDTVADTVLSLHSLENIRSTFKQLYAQIGCFKCEPSFRNVFEAVYHYYKHREVPEKGEVLTVPRYFGMITSMLTKARSLKQFQELTNSSEPRKKLVFDRMFTAFGRKVRLVLNVRDGNVKLTSCYFLDVLCQCKDGEEFIDTGLRKKMQK